MLPEMGFFFPQTEGLVVSAHDRLTSVEVSFIILYSCESRNGLRPLQARCGKTTFPIHENSNVPLSMLSVGRM